MHPDHRASSLPRSNFLAASPSRVSNALSARPPRTPSIKHPTLMEIISDHRWKLEGSQDSIALNISNLAKELEDLKSKHGVGDVKLELVAHNGFRVLVDAHRRILSSQSVFFREKLESKQKEIAQSIEITDCKDIGVYLETLVLIYCEDIANRLMGLDVLRILDLLKASAAINFNAGTSLCVKHLEAVPWPIEDEETIISVLNHLHLPNIATEALQRVSSELSTSSQHDDIFSVLFHSIFQATHGRACHEMKTTISSLLKEHWQGSNGPRVSMGALYSHCHMCLRSIILHMSEATSLDSGHDRAALMAGIAHQAANLRWVVEILISNKMCGEFVMLWSEQRELAVLHGELPSIFRHEVSKITAQLCVAIGRGEILVPWETRFLLLSTWLEPLYEDFGWMARSRYFDRKAAEEGIGSTILTLPLIKQQTVLLNWFNRFLNKGDDCPNIKGAFEVWWRRAFVHSNTLNHDT